MKNGFLTSYSNHLPASATGTSLALAGDLRDQTQATFATGTNIESDDTSLVSTLNDNATCEPKKLSIFQQFWAFYFSYSTLHRAVLEENIKYIKSIGEFGGPDIDIDATNTRNETALHLAAREGSYSVLYALFMKGANCNIQNIRGETPLHISARRGHSKMVILLLNKADPTIQNNKGQTPLDLTNRITITHSLKQKIKYMQKKTALVPISEEIEGEGVFDSLSNALYFGEPYAKDEGHVEKDDVKVSNNEVSNKRVTL